MKSKIHPVIRPDARSDDRANHKSQINPNDQNSPPEADPPQEEKPKTKKVKKLSSRDHDLGIQK